MKLPAALSLVLFLTSIVGAQRYDYVPNDFSIRQPTKFQWTDAPLTWLTGINIVGSTDPNEIIALPLDYAACSNSTLVNGQNQCIAWTSNGTALFGGPYASGLILGHKYFISLGWVNQTNAAVHGLANSTAFDLVNAVVTSSVTVTAPPTSTPTSSYSAQTSASMVSSGSTMSNGEMIGIAIGTSAIAILLAGGIYLLWRRSAERTKKIESLSAQSSGSSSSEPDRSSFMPPKISHLSQTPMSTPRMSMLLPPKVDYFDNTKRDSYRAGELPADSRPQPQELDSTPYDGPTPELDNSESSVKHESYSFGSLGALLSRVPRTRASSSFGGSTFGGTEGSAVGSVITQGEVTPAQLYALEEEEKRIDDAIRESERLVELKVQRASVQVRINAARMSTIAAAP